MRTHRHSRLVATAVVAAVCAVVGAVPAQADDPTDTTADLIAGVAPDQGQVVPGTTTDDQISVQADNTQVTVPTDPGQPITMNDPAATPAVTVNLPTEVTANKAKVAHDGTVVYHTTKAHGTSVAVQVLADGATRLQTITPDAHSTRQFTYTFGKDIVPIVGKNGTIELLRDYGDVAMTVGTVDKAWAVDAKGHHVTTSYQIKNGALVQTITPGSHTVYPVVADPKVTNTWWNTTVYFNKKETILMAGGSGGVAAVAGSIPVVGTIIAAAAGVTSAYASTVASIGKCMKAVVYLHAPPAILQPYSGSEAGGYCK